MANVQKPMLDPVMVLETGMTYERANIEAWIQSYMYEPFFKRSQPSTANEPPVSCNSARTVLLSISHGKFAPHFAAFVLHSAN